jgi:hypothetical protein
LIPAELRSNVTEAAHVQTEAKTELVAILWNTVVGRTVKANLSFAAHLAILIREAESRLLTLVL